MQDIDQTMAAVRVVESDDDYRFQTMADVGGTPTHKLGAYGITGARWQQLTEAAGIPGASWNDRAAQDRIAREHLQRGYDQLGDWGMAVIAFRFGMQAATELTNRGYTDPASIEAAGYPDMANYLRDAKRGQPDPQRPVTGHLTTGGTQQKTSPTRRRADDIIRKQLYALRNAQRGVSDVSDTEVEQGGDTGVPAGAE